MNNKYVNREETRLFLTLALGLLAHYVEERDEEYLNSAGHVLHDFRHYIDTGEKRALLLPDGFLDQMANKLQ